jgi:type IV pilus assembly protein PilB
MAQRLLRRICKKCAKKISPSSELLKVIEKNLKNIPENYRPKLEDIKIPQAQGCLECHQSGYKGRIGIYEMFKITPKIEEVINSSPSISEMRKVIFEEGMISMQQDGLLRVIEGITTLKELERITGPIE